MTFLDGTKHIKLSDHAVPGANKKNSSLSILRKMSYFFTESFYYANDKIAYFVDVHNHRRKFKPVALDNHVPLSKYNHIDFIWGKV